MNQRHTKHIYLYLFEFIFHDDFKYRHKIPQCVKRFCDILAVSAHASYAVKCYGKAIFGRVIVTFRDPDSVSKIQLKIPYSDIIQEPARQ